MLYYFLLVFFCDGRRDVLRQIHIEQNEQTIGGALIMEDCFSDHHVGLLRSKSFK